MPDLEGQPLGPGDYAIVRVKIRQTCDGSRNEYEANHVDKDGDVLANPVILPGRALKKTQSPEPERLTGGGLL